MKTLILLLLLIPNLVMAASFDCAKASTKHEKMICDNPELNEADEEMGDMYFLALKTFKEDTKEIKVAQKEFNKKYRKCKVLDKCLSVIKQRVDELGQRFGGKYCSMGDSCEPTGDKKVDGNIEACFQNWYKKTWEAVTEDMIRNGEIKSENDIESKFQVIPRGAMIMKYSDCFFEEGGVDVLIKKDKVSARIDELTVPLADVADNFKALTQEFILENFPICQVKWMGFMKFCKGQPIDRSLNDIGLSFKTEKTSDSAISFTHDDGKSYYSFTVKKNQITLTSQALDGGTYLASTTYHLKNDAGKWLIIGEEGITYKPKETHPYAAYKTPIYFLGDNQIIQKKEKDSFCTTSNTDKSTLSNYSIIAVNAAYNLQKELIDAVNTSNLEKLNKLFTHDLLASIKLKDLKSSDYALILKNDYKKLLNDKGISCNSVGLRGWMLASGKVWIQAYKDEVRIISLHK
jgi:uncharacterized protein